MTSKNMTKMYNKGANKAEIPLLTLDFKKLKGRWSKKEDFGMEYGRVLKYSHAARRREKYKFLQESL